MPGAQEARRISIATADRAMKQTLAKRSVSMKGVRIDDDIKDGRCPYVPIGGVLGEDTARHLGPFLPPIES
jgi:hypothetical protein